MRFEPCTHNFSCAACSMWFQIFPMTHSEDIQKNNFDPCSQSKYREITGPHRGTGSKKNRRFFELFSSLSRLCIGIEKCGIILFCSPQVGEHDESRFKFFGQLLAEIRAKKKLFFRVSYQCL
jgi:hypothetical protein